MWNQYRKTALQEMRRYIEGEDLTGTSVAPGETPKVGGMIARDAQGSQWYVSPEFMAQNYEKKTMGLNDDLDKVVDDFADAIKTKLLSKQQRGYFGFDVPHMQGPIEQKLKRNLRDKDWVDVGALAAMRWNFTMRID